MIKELQLQFDIELFLIHVVSHIIYIILVIYTFVSLSVNKYTTAFRTGTYIIGPTYYNYTVMYIGIAKSCY